MNAEKVDDTKTILITGAAGFIGFHLSRKLLDEGIHVVGFDNLNAYYDVSLKMDRLDILNKYPKFTFIKGDLSNKSEVDNVFSNYSPDIVVNLAAQAGVRYSIDNPQTYIDSNVIGFFNILESCRYFSVEHLLFASSSSVYGNQQKVPFSVEDNVDKPMSLYAATKKSNELMGYSYSHLFHIPMTGLRFFTVYGPYGRPDMAYYRFANKIYNNEPIQIFNRGNMLRDFTYIDDIINCIYKMLKFPPKADEYGNQFKVYNIGNNKPEKLWTFITTLEHVIGRTAIKEYLPMQPGDVYQTYADVSELVRDFEFKPNTEIEKGLKNFINWYKQYYKV